MSQPRSPDARPDDAARYLHTLSRSLLEFITVSLRIEDDTVRFKTQLQRLKQTVADRGPTQAEIWQRTVEGRIQIIRQLADAIVASEPIAPDLLHEVGQVLRVYWEIILVNGWVPEDDSHPLAQFAAHLFLDGAVLPRPFPIPLLEALCHPDAKRVFQHGCQRCCVLLPERVIPGRHPEYGPFESVITPCPVCGSSDLGWFHRQGQGLRIYETQSRSGVARVRRNASH